MEPPVAQSLQQFHSRISAIEELLRRSEGTLSGILSRMKNSEISIQTVHKITNDRIPNDFRAISEDIGGLRKKLELVDQRAKPMVDGALVQYDTELRKILHGMDQNTMKSIVDSQNTIQATLRSDREESQTSIRKVSDYVQAEARANQQLGQEVKLMGDHMKDLQQRTRDIEITTGKRLDQQQVTLSTMKKELGDYVTQLMDTAMSRFKEELNAALSNEGALRLQMAAEVGSAISTVRDEMGQGLQNALKSISNIDETTQALEAVIRAEIKARMGRYEELNRRLYTLDEQVQVDGFNRDAAAGAATTVDSNELTRVFRIATEGKNQSDSASRNVVVLQDEIKGLAGQVRTFNLEMQRQKEELSSVVAKSTYAPISSTTSVTAQKTIDDERARRCEEHARAAAQLQTEVSSQREALATYKVSQDELSSKAHRTIELLAGQLAALTEAFEILHSNNNNSNAATTDTKRSSSTVPGGDAAGGGEDVLSREFYSEIRSLKSKLRSSQASTDAELERLSDEVEAMRQFFDQHRSESQSQQSYSVQSQSITTNDTRDVSISSAAVLPIGVTSVVGGGGDGVGGGVDVSSSPGKKLASVEQLELGLRSLSLKLGVTIDEIREKLREVDMRSARGLQEAEARLAERANAVAAEVTGELQQRVQINTKSIRGIREILSRLNVTVAAWSPRGEQPQEYTNGRRSPRTSSPTAATKRNDSPDRRGSPRRADSPTSRSPSHSNTSSPARRQRGDGDHSEEVEFHTFRKVHNYANDEDYEASLDPEDAVVEELSVSEGGPTESKPEVGGKVEVSKTSSASTPRSSRQEKVVETPSKDASLSSAPAPSPRRSTQAAPASGASETTTTSATTPTPPQQISSVTKPSSTTSLASTRTTLRRGAASGPSTGNTPRDTSSSSTPGKLTPRSEANPLVKPPTKRDAPSKGPSTPRK